VRFVRPLSWLLPWGTLVLAGAQDLRVGAYVESSELWVDLETRTRHNDVTLRPNFALQPGVSLYYKGYGAALSPPTRGIARDDAEIPPSRYQDYRIFYYGSRWGVEGYLQSTRGYYSDPLRTRRGSCTPRLAPTRPSSTCIGLCAPARSATTGFRTWRRVS
jgi:hypothetical protein